MVVKRLICTAGVDRPGPAVAVAARAVEHGLALLFELVETRIRIRQRRRSCSDRVRQRANPMVREQHALKRGQVVQQLLRRDILDLRVIDECAGGLLLKRRETRVQLVAARRIGVAWPDGKARVRSRQGDVVHGGHHAPHVYGRLVRHGIGRGIDEPDGRWQRERNPDETVLAKIAEIAGRIAVRPKIVRIDRPEQRIVSIRVPAAPQLQQAESRLDARRRELEVVRRHVAVGARAAVSVEAVRLPIEEREEAPLDGVARLAATVEGRSRRCGDAVRAGRR